ncbi:unnamed protein product [Rotaria sordida]|uniref:Uncharacterized protein n=1 Tax=Rotaria sordida TaxID=392033 RepID=A0A813PIB7_9BILA|nr:unnamed protein product [Rotaria sordida]CAF0837243.1 unnamed protein product [Rotaria sordida]
MQSCLFICLCLFIYNCYAHEHQNHIDPATTQYSQSAINVDPLSKHIETTNVQKNEFQQSNDDEHVGDTIEARLRAKHDLRQSVHQQSIDDKSDNEQDYINRLNSALEKEYKKEPESQHIPPPIVDTIHNAPSQNQIKENVEVPPRILNETTSRQTPQERQQHTSDEQPSTQAPPIIDTVKHAQILDEKLHLKPVSNEIISPTGVQTNEQQPIGVIQEKVIKEDISTINKETLPSTQSHQQNETLNIVKPITNHIPPSSDQQQSIANAIINQTVPNNSGLDVKSSFPTSSQIDQSQQLKSDTIQKVSSPDSKLDQQQPVLETIQNGHSLDQKLSSPTPIKEDQKPQIYDSIQTVNSLDPKPDRQQPVSEAIPNAHSLDLTLQQQQQTSDTTQNASPVHQSASSPTIIKEDQKQQISDTIQHVSSSNQQQSSSETQQHVGSLDQKQQAPETIQNTGSIDHNTPSIQVDQQAQVINTMKPTESVPTVVKSDNILSENKEPPTNIRTSPPSARVLRGATTRTTQTAQGRHRHLHSKQEEPEKISTTDSTIDTTSSTTMSTIESTKAATIAATLSSTMMPIVESTQAATIESTLSSTMMTTTIEPILSSTMMPIVESTQAATIESTLSSTVMTTTIESILSSTMMPIVESTQAATIESTLSSTIMSTVESTLASTITSTVESIKAATIESTLSSTTMPTVESTLPSTMMPITAQSIEERIDSVESSLLGPKEPHVEIVQQPIIDLNVNNEVPTDINEQNKKFNDVTDLPRQVHVHDPQAILDELEEESNKNEKQNIDKQIESHTTVASFLANDHSPHLPRILENEQTTPTIDSTIETMTNTIQTNSNRNEINQPFTHSDLKVEKTNNSPTSTSNNNKRKLPIIYPQICWHLPNSFHPIFELIENQTLGFVNLLPEFIQTTLFEYIDNRETIMNTVWFGSICSMCFLFSFVFLSIGATHLKHNKQDKKIRAQCQQLQQFNNQIELERATFEKQNQELSDQIDELRKLPVCDTGEEIFELRERYERLHADCNIARNENDILQNDIDYKTSVIQKYEFDMHKQVETIASLNDEVLRQKQELEKEQETIIRLQSIDLSLDHVEKLEGIIHELKSEITQLKQDKLIQLDQLDQVQERANQLDIDNNQLTIKMKQLKDLLEQKDETIAQIREKILNNDDDDDDDEEKTTEISNLLSTVKENINDNDQQELLSNIDNDIEKANQHMRHLHTDIDEKTRRIKELDLLLNQEKDRCKELETKLKVVLELRERDAHLHIRQLGQTDAELRKARTDTERVRILQQQLEFKQKQLEDVQKVLASEQTKFNEESSKLQHETHEKWMEVKRLTRELDGSRKECESLRRQITKYANSERLSQEQTMHKPIPQHINNSSRMSSEPEISSNSSPLPYQQGENFRPIDHERNDSGAASPAEMFRIRPPLFGLSRPPFFPPPFMPPPRNPFMMGSRFPMPIGGPHGLISPIQHLITNGSNGGSDANSFEIVDSVNITPNSTSYDAQLNGSAASPIPNDEQQATTKPKKPKKSLKKKTKTSTTTPAPTATEDV